MAEKVMHTPGPWYEGEAPRTGRLCVLSDEAWICGQIDNNDTDEGKANARLIAAAPETLVMLDDLADVVEAYLVHGDVDLSAWIAKARAQILKATGE